MELLNIVSEENSEMLSESKKDDKLPSFFEYTKDVGLHGYRQVAGAEKGIRRIIWCVLFFGSIGVSAKMFCDSVEAYYSNSVYLQIEDFKFPDNNLLFPTVSLCNKVALVKQGFQRVKNIVNVTEKEFEDFHDRYFSRYRGKIVPNPSVEKKILDALYKHNITRTEDAISLFEINRDDMLGHPVAKLFLKTRPGDPDYPTCRFDDTGKCLSENTLSRRESLCHQINYFDVHTTSQLGWNARFKKFGKMIAVVNIASTDYHPKTNRVRSEAPYMDLVEGLVVYLHQYGDMHEYAEFTKRIFLRPGFWHFVKIDYIEIYHLPKPYSFACGTKPMNRIKKAINYTHSLCILDCLIDIKLAECGCVGWEIAKYVRDEIPICEIAHAHCYINNRTNHVKTCRKTSKCPRDCVQHRYEINVETINLREDNVLERAMGIPGWHMNREETENFIQRNLVGIQFMYSSVAKKEILRPSVTLNGLIGTIGGTLGLCVGFNILIIFEYLRFVYNYLSLLWNR